MTAASRRWCSASTTSTAAIQRRRRLQQLLEPLPLELLSGPLHLLAFTPRGLTPAEADGWSAQTRQQLLERQLMLSRPLHAGRHHLKAVLGNPYTAEAQLQAIAACVAESLTPLAVSAQP